MSVSEPITAITERVARLRRRLQEQELDALLVTNPENRRYLSGFSGHDDGAESASALVVSRDATSLITDGRCTELAARACPGLRVIHRQGPFAPLAAETLLATGARRIGFEAAHVTVAGRDDLAGALAEKAGDAAPPELVATRALVEPLRAVKDGAELAAIEHGVAITDATFTYLGGYLRAGLTEKHVAREVERYMLRHGADGMAFTPIGASGPTAALPHVGPSASELPLGEPIIIDVGARVAGYCADVTRTV